jgi:DNA primase
MLPSGKDPDEYLKKNSNNWDKIVSEALPIMEYYLRSALASVKSSLEEVADLNIGDKKKIIQSILPNIAQLANLVEQDLWIKKISDLLKIGEESVRGEFVKMKKPVSEARAGEEEKPEHQDATGQEGAMGDALLGLIFTLQDGVQKYFADIDPELFWVEDQKKIVNLIKKCYAVKEEKVVIDQPLWDKLLTIELKKYIDHLIFIAEIEFKTDKTKELEKYIDKMFIFLKRKYLGRKLVKIEQDLAQAEGAKDQDRVKKLTSLASELSKQITKLKII